MTRTGSQSGSSSDGKPLALRGGDRLPANSRRAGKPLTGKVKATSPQPTRVRASVSRLLLVWLILMVSGLGLLANLYRLQVVKAPELLKQARQQQIVYLRPFIPRRPIVDRIGNVLAVDRPIYTLYAHPVLFKLSKADMATRLAPILNQTATALVKRFGEAESGIQLNYGLPEEVADRIADLNLDGLELIQAQQRLYPQKDLAADVVGYVNVDRQGQAGVEYSRQDWLERAVQVVRFTRTGTGSLIPAQASGESQKVDDLRLQLTLDSRLQRVARQALEQQIKNYRAKRGGIIVMDARDGSILALVASPSYDPNQYSKFNLELFKNWTITDLYEPGSTFKPLNVAIALEAKAIKANDIFNDEGRIQVGGWPIEDYDYSIVGARGPLTVAQILQHSSNVGMVRIVQQMTPAAFYNWLQRMGLGKPSGIDLPFEMASQLKNRDQFIQASIEPATTSFGQGFSLTPMQLVQLHGALANGGKLVTPRVVRGLQDANGTLRQVPSVPAPKQIFSSQTARTVLEMMETVVTEGTGKSVQIPGYRIAGKTGTAQKANPNGGYYDRAKITSFVGIMPVDAPRYVVLAVIDEPQGDNAFGSTVAAPLVKTVMETLVTIEGIPPSTNARPPAPTP